MSEPTHIGELIRAVLKKWPIDHERLKEIAARAERDEILNPQLHCTGIKTTGPGLQTRLKVQHGPVLPPPETGCRDNTRAWESHMPRIYHIAKFRR